MKKYLLILFVIILGCEEQETNCRFFVKDESKKNVTRIIVQYDNCHDELDRFAIREKGQWVELKPGFRYIEFHMYNDGRFSSSGYEWPIQCRDSLIFRSNQLIDVIRH